jgi:hypothetical protein
LTTLLLCLTALAQEGDAAPAAESPFAGPWKAQPSVRPAIGASVFSDGVNAYAGAALGAEVGATFFQPEKQREDLRFVVRPRALGQIIVGPSTSGYDVHGGVFAGPRWQILGLTLGPDVFTNRFTYGPVLLDPVVGMGVPVIADVDLQVLSVYGGLEPIWFFSGDRPTVDWSTTDPFGFGHEFAWTAGAAVQVGRLGLSASYNIRQTAFGPQRGFGFGLSL